MLARCIHSIFCSKKQPLEVIIIDGSEGVEGLQEANRDSKALRIVHRHIPGIGLPQARNAAVRAANGDILLFVDDDCELFPETLTRLENLTREARAECIIGKIVNKDPCVIPACVQQAYYDIWITSITRSAVTRVVQDDVIPGLDIAAFPRKTLLRFPFREDIPFGIDEDIELGGRLRRSGIIVRFDSKVCAFHSGRMSTVGLFKRNFLNGYANEHTKKRYGINTREITRRMPIPEKVVIARRNSVELQGIRKILFWTVFLMYPAFSAAGRFTFLILQGAERVFHHDPR